MPAVHRGQHFDKIALKWYGLADRRLEYFVELYQSGRWKHYYTRERFVLRMLDVIKATKLWGELVDRLVTERNAARDDHLRPAA
jgi:hypothetical protein